MNYELLMINVARDYSSYSSCFRDSIGQYIIAGYLEKFDFKAFVFSGKIEDCEKEIKKAIEIDGVPVIGFYTAADNIRIVAHFIKWIKKEYPNVKTVIGGPQAIGIDYNFFKDTHLDYAILGEGEIPTRYLLEAIVDSSRKIEEVPSLLYMNEIENTLYFNEGKNVVINELDLLPYPKLENSLIGNLRQGPTVGIITGRGCPYKCAFCYEGANAKNVRFRSIDNVIEEIQYISNINKKLEYISIYDDTFTLKKERVLEFCSKIKKLGINWFCEGHISFVNKHKEVIEEMVNSGLACIQFGIESGSNDVLSAYNKQTDFESILKAVKTCKEYGISGITGNFIIGGAVESRETLEDSKKLAKALIENAKGIIEIYVVYLAPYPNTRIVNNPEKFEITLQPELENYNLNTMRSPVVKTNKLSTKEIYEEKKNFEDFLQDIYRKAAYKPNKKDLLQGLTKDGKRIHINPTWEKYYLEQPYIAVFLDHISEEEQNFDSSKYIIRTFEDILLDDDVLRSEVGDFYGLEKEILLNATGINTAKEMALKFNVEIEEIESCYNKLNNKCLVYMSKY